MTVSYFSKRSRNSLKDPQSTKVSCELSEKIEQLRNQLVNAVELNGFCSDIVIELSQRLDTYIVMAQHEMVGH